jgi:hypothetical protein
MWKRELQDDNHSIRQTIALALAVTAILITTQGRVIADCDPLVCDCSTCVTMSEVDVCMVACKVESNCTKCTAPFNGANVNRAY